MEKGLKELLESSVLGEDTKAALSEAWNQKLDETRKAIREEESAKLREEYADRFEADKSDLVEAMNNMLVDALNEQVTEIAEEKAKLEEQHVKLVAERAAQENVYKAKIAEHAKTLNKFVFTKLKEELAEVFDEVKSLKEMGNNALEKTDAEIAEVKEGAKAGMAMLESFVREQMTKELEELAIDKRELTEQRVRLAAEARNKLNEARKQFVARASKIVESTVESRLRSELTQLKDDLREARENHFGRKLFEAFQTEFMASHLVEGTKIGKLTKDLDAAKRQLQVTNSKLNESVQEKERLARRITISEERFAREKKLNELLSPLSRDKKMLMSELLESVKTDSLKAAFDKYLPSVLKETAGNLSQGRRVLSETRTQKKPVEITGNRKTRLTESAEAEGKPEEVTSEIINLRRLAGL